MNGALANVVVATIHWALRISKFIFQAHLLPLTSQRVVAIRKEVGGLIRRLRSRREITQAALASLTGIHRTYLSRAERVLTVRNEMRRHPHRSRRLSQHEDVDDFACPSEFPQRLSAAPVKG